MKNKFKLIAATWLIVGVHMLAQEQTTLELSLTDAQEYALEHNKTLKNAQLDVTSNDRKIWEIISDGLPQVDGSVDYITYFGYEIPFSFGGSGESPITDDIMQGIFYDAAMEYPSANFSTIKASNYIDNQITANMPAQTIKMSDQSTAKLQITQLIFSGLYFTGIQTAKIARRLTDLSMKNTEMDIKEAVISSYFMILITERSMEIIKANISNLKETLKQTNAMYEAGMAEKMDVDQLRVSVSMLDHSLNATVRSLSLNYNMLRLQLGLEAGAGITLSDDLDGLIESSHFSKKDGTEFLMEENITYKLMQSQEDLNEKLVDMQRWNYAPTISGFYTFNHKLLTTGFDMTPNHMLGFNLALPIFSSGKRKAQVDIARIELEKAQNSKSLIMDQLQLQENQLRFNYNNAIDNFNIQKANTRVAESVLETYQRKYDQGIMSTLDLTQANNNYLAAENGYVQALMTLLQAQLALDKLNSKL